MEAVLRWVCIHKAVVSPKEAIYPEEVAVVSPEEVEVSPEEVDFQAVAIVVEAIAVVDTVAVVAINGNSNSTNTWYQSGCGTEIPVPLWCPCYLLCS